MSQTEFNSELCLYCPDLCLFTCPAVEGSGSITNSPYAKVNALHWSTTNANGAPDRRESLDKAYLCTDCGLCTEVCEHDQPVARHLYQHRQEAFVDFRAPHRADAMLPDEDAGRAVLEEAAKLTGSKGSYSIAFFPGCVWINEGAERIAQVIEQLKRVGIVDVAVDPNGPVCCGAPWRDLGDQAGYLARVASWRRLYTRAQGVIVGDPSCERALTQHVSAGFDAQTDNRKPKETRLFALWNVLIRSLRSPVDDKLKLNLAIHESCHENRGLKRNRHLHLLRNLLHDPAPSVSQIPRQEPCCGCAGGMDKSNPKIAQNAARTFLERTKLAGFDQVLSLAPSCAKHLKAAKTPGLPDTINIVELLELFVREQDGANHE